MQQTFEQVDKAIVPGGLQQRNNQSRGSSFQHQSNIPISVN